MSNITTETDKPAAPAEPETETNPHKPAKPAKSAKKAKAGKKAKSVVKKSSAKPGAERTNKKADVIAMMKRAKGATLAQIAEAMGWQCSETCSNAPRGLSRRAL